MKTENPPAGYEREIPLISFEDKGILPVSASAINDKLNELWEGAHDGSSDSEHPGEGYTRLSLGDLVVLADDSTLPQAEKLILGFAQERPSRSILILIESEKSTTPAKHTAPTAEVAIACNFTPQHSGTVCWERITIHLPADSLKIIPSLVRSLTSEVNRLVVVDCYSQVLPESVNSDLHKLAGYIFFDTRVNDQKLQNKIKGGAGLTGRFFDLEYERGHELREVIKNSFDNPDALSQLSRLVSVRFLSSLPEGSSYTSLLYLCAWIATKLRLKPVRSNVRKSFVFQREDGTEVVISCGLPSDFVAPEGVTVGAETVGVSFGFSDGEPAQILILRNVDETDFDKTQSYSIYHDGALQSSIRLEPLDEAAYILRRVSDTFRRDDYLESLRQAVTLTSLSEGATAAPVGHCVLYRLADKNLLVQSAAEMFVAIMRESVIRRGVFTVALAGGSTPVDLYRRLSGSVYADCTEWRDTLFFFGDERTVPPTHENSNYLMAKRSLFDPLQIDEERVWRMAGEGDDLGSSVEEYQRLLERLVPSEAPGEAPALDLILLGLGEDGHTASIFPDYPESEIPLDRLVADVYVGSQETHRLTMTPTLINSARNIIFLISGASKAEAVSALLAKKSAPANRIFPRRGRLIHLLDNSASSRIDPGIVSCAIERW